MKVMVFDVGGTEIKYSVMDEQLNRTDTGFGSDETWDYTKIDLKEIPYVDEEQANFIDQNRGYYSQDMAKDYYEGQHYGCSVSDIH